MRIFLVIDGDGLPIFAYESRAQANAVVDSVVNEGDTDTYRDLGYWVRPMELVREVRTADVEVKS